MLAVSWLTKYSSRRCYVFGGQKSEDSGHSLIYYRDPLLDTISDRIADLDRPAYIKNSELVYVAVNDAYARR